MIACLLIAAGCGTAGHEHVAERAPESGAPVASGPTTRPVLRISADPNNLPFTNEKLGGFENRLAELIGKDLGMDVEYAWRAQRRGFFRHALKEGEGELVLGVPRGFDMALTTIPYYTSTYAFVYRADRGYAISSLDDSTLRTLKVGVQLVGDDGVNTPPAHALARRGIIHNVVGYTLYGDYRQPSPPSRIIKAVADGEIDVAIVWGPLAGYFAPRQAGVALKVVPVSPRTDMGLPMTFDICMGVQKGNRELRDRLNEFIKRHREEIGRILDQYGVSRLADTDAARDQVKVGATESKDVTAGHVVRQE